MEYDEYVVDLNADCKCGCMDVGRLHKIYHFPNDLGASVVGNRSNPTAEYTSYQVMLLKFTGPETFMNVMMAEFGTNIVTCDDWKGVVEILTKLKSM